MQDLYNKVVETLKQAKANKEARNVIESLEKISSMLKNLQLELMHEFLMVIQVLMWITHQIL